MIYSIGRDITLEKQKEFEEQLKAKQSILAEQLTKEASEFKSYFMTKFSHQLRNTLTTISGYHQILLEKKYEDDEEMQTFLQLAIDETQELLSSTSDLFDVAGFGKDGSKILQTLNISNIFHEALVEFKKLQPSKDIILKFEEGSQFATIVSDREQLRTAFTKLYSILTTNENKCTIEIQILESSSEGIAEMQLLAQPNELVGSLINIYNENINNLLDALRFDQDDILLNLALFASTIRILNGQVKLENLGSDGILISLILPKRQ